VLPRVVGASAMCGWGGNGWMWNGGYGGWDWVGWILTAVVLVVVFALVLTVVAMAVRYLSVGREAQRSHKAPEKCWLNVLPAPRS